MIIQSSSIGMNSTHTYRQTAMSATSLTTLTAFASPTNSNSSIKDLLNGGGSSFSNRMNSLIEQFEQSRSVQAVQAKDEFRSIKQIQFESLNYLMQILFHREVQPADNSELQNMSGSVNPPIGLNLAESYASYEETETTTFETTGKVVTADGREIDFNLSLSMTRSFQESYYMSSLTAAPLCDPLVINLDTNVTSVSDQQFLFDIDADGQMDSISNLGAGSGFLALDKNGDGKINDGSELFGTSSGDGFKDLAAYDTDGNGWIDEADEIFDQLRIWTRNADGEDVLCGLGAAGVGAIYLGNVSTNFSLNNAETNETNALIRKTGLFLYENGAAGTIQHVDLAKHDATALEA